MAQLTSATRNCVLGILAKQPLPGQVKTRLAAATSHHWAAKVAHAFLQDLIDRLGKVPAHRVIAYSPPESRDYFFKLAGKNFDLWPQTEGHLGQRMAAFFGQALSTGAERVVLVGSDCPDLPLEFVEQAFLELTQSKVVLGPATDGGYYLVGSAGRIPPLFASPRWSHGRVLEEAIATLTDPSWKLALLPPWYDVDDIDDWQMLRGHVQAKRRAGLDPGIAHSERLMLEDAGEGWKSGS
jgi:rSAM/selenodomain-associated transferase 1